MSKARGGAYRVAAVSQLTGISPFVLRVWERRYGPIAKSRAAGGGRLYDDADVARLRLVKRLIDRGHAAGDVVPLPMAQLERLVAEHHADGVSIQEPLLRVARERFVEAVSRFDVASATRVFAQASIAMDPLSLVEDLAAPILTRIGEDWEAGKTPVAVEHAASAIVRSQLGLLLRPPPTGGDVCVATTPAGEGHELGALFAALVATAAGWGVHYLGPSLPAKEIAGAVANAQARIALVSIIALPPRAARHEVRAIREALPADVQLWLGGTGARGVEAEPGLRVFRDLRRFERELRGELEA